VAYRVDGLHCLDVFDRVGRPSSANMKAAMLASPDRTKLRPHHVRAFRAAPRKGFKLNRRTLHSHVSLDGISADEMHAAIASVVKVEHGKGFSYARGHHCQGFSNTLFGRLCELRSQKDRELRGGVAGLDERGDSPPPLTPCNSMCHSGCLPRLVARVCCPCCLRKPKLRVALLELGGSLAELCTDLAAQEAAAATCTDGAPAAAAVGAQSLAMPTQRSRSRIRRWVPGGAVLTKRAAYPKADSPLPATAPQAATLPASEKVDAD